MLRPAATSLLFLIFLCTSALAGVDEEVLPNGLKILTVEDHRAPIAVFQMWYRVGSRDEVSGRTGMSHLLEHMMFKGTEKYGSKVLSRTVKKYGGTDNAFTSLDYTAYFQILPAEKLDLSLEFESDRMQNLLLEADEVSSERSVVMEERRLRYEDDPQNSLYEETLAAAFKVHPYHWPVIGWMPDLASITRDGLLRHYRENYCPGNAVVVMAGDIDTGEVVKKVKEKFGGIRPCPPKEDLVSSEPPQDGEKRVNLRREAELPYLLMAYHTPTLAEDDGYALDVLSTILSGGKSGRLYESLVYKRKIALSAFTDYSSIMRDPYLFIIGATASPGHDAQEIEEALQGEVARIQEEPPSDFELQKAVNQTEADFVMGQDSAFSQAMLLGRFEMMGDWHIRDSYIEKIRGVTAEDVSRVARKYLKKSNETVGVLIPEKHQEAAERASGETK